MNRKLLHQALDALKEWDALIKYQFGGSSEAMSAMQYAAWHTEDAIAALQTELAKPEQELVEHAVIAGVLFDFMGWLTSRQERLVLSASDEASPAVKVIQEFANMRELSLDDAKVKNWQNMLALPRKEWVGLTSEDWENLPDTGKQGCERDAEIFDWIESKLKELNT